MATVTMNVHDTPKALYDALPAEEETHHTSRWRRLRVENTTITFFPALDELPSITDAL